MRDLGALSSYISGMYALNPLPMVVIHWSSGVKYYTKETLFDYETTLVSISNLSTTQSHKNFTQINSVSVVLQDFDQALRQTVEANGFEGIKCEIAIHGIGMDEGDHLVLFTGKATAPIVWNEAERTLSFDVFTKHDHVTVSKVLTSVELGLAPWTTLMNLDRRSLEGKTLPLVLGCMVKSPALRLTKQFESILITDITYNHYSVEDIAIADSDSLILGSISESEEIFEGFHTNIHTLNAVTHIEADGHIFTVLFSEYVDMNGNPDSDNYRRYAKYLITDINPQKYRLNNLETDVRDDNDPDVDNPKVFWIKDSGIRLEGNFITIGQAPDGTNIYTSNLCEKQVGRKCFFAEPWTYKYTYISNSISYINRKPIIINDEVPIEYISSFMPNPADEDDFLGYNDLVGDNKIVSIQQGTTLRVWVEDSDFGLQEEVYFVNSIPSTVNSVCSKRSEIFKQELPYLLNDVKSYYEIVSGWESTQYIILRFPIPLSDFPGEGWSDDVFVTLRSLTLIPILDGTQDSPNAPWGNVAEIIRWLIENTPGHDYIADDTSFDAVAILVANFPATVGVYEEQNLFDLIGEIAWQARCALTLVGDVIKIRYLSRTPTTPDFIIDDTTVLQKFNEELIPALILEIPTINELIRIFKYQYKESQDGESIQKSIDISLLSPNINNALQGLNTLSYDFFIYNKGVCAEQSAIFWLNRKAYLWRKFTFNLPLEALAVEVFDNVKIDFQNTDVLKTYSSITSSTVYAQAIATEYDFERNMVRLIVDVPVPIGSLIVNSLFWRVINIPRPKNPACKDLKTFYDPFNVEDVPQHRFVKHKDITLYSRMFPTGIEATPLRAEINTGETV